MSAPTGDHPVDHEGGEENVIDDDMHDSEFAEGDHVSRVIRKLLCTDK